MCAGISSRRSPTDREFPLRTTRRAGTPNRIPAGFGHDVCLGTHTNRTRRPASVGNALRVATDSSTPLPPSPSHAAAIPHNDATRNTSVAEARVVGSSASKTHPTPGSVATVRSTWVAKSFSPRVARTVGASARPAATPKFPIGRCAPCRSYANATSST